MKVINLFGSPGTGKSTTAAGLFFLMKHKGMKVELINEYAKELVWAERHHALSDQIYILAKQNAKLERLRNKVDWVITDSPLLFGLIYKPEDYYAHFTNLLFELWLSYDNECFFLRRTKPYIKLGRTQTESESDALATKISNLLDLYHFNSYTKINATKKAPEVILKKLINT